MEQLDATPISAEEFYVRIGKYLTPRQVEFVREAYNLRRSSMPARNGPAVNPTSSIRWG